MKNHSQTTDGNSYNSSYVYNLSGALIEETYPSGRVVKNTLDQDGDLQQVQSKKLNDTFKNYANAFIYTSAGAVSSLRLGNGKFENTTFNNRLQPIQISLGSSATSQNLLKLNFDYGGTDNNGNVKSQTITTPTVGTNQGFVATQIYAYDSLNRLKSAVEMIPNQTGWKQTFIFDRYGNRTFDTTNNNTTTLANGCPINICNPTANPIDNKLVGTNYDSVGNTSQDANGQTFVYDAENKQVQVNNAGGIVGQYFYDGDGKRIKKIAPLTNETTIFVYNADGKTVAEYSTIFANQTNAKINYITTDHLGSPRINTDSNGNVIARHDTMPFGEEIQRANYGSDNLRNRFTSYERDGETGLDYAKARMFGSGVGRFTSPDPLMASAKPSNPQTFNRYIYVLNNPFKFIDPDGLKPVYLSRTQNGVTSYWYGDDKWDDYTKQIDNGFTLFKPAANQVFVDDNDRIIEFTKTGFKDLGAAGNATANIYTWGGFNGHIAVEFVLGKRTLYLSFYPDGFNGKSPGHWYSDHEGVLATKERDFKDEKPDVFTIDKLDWAAAAKYYNTLKENPGKWSLGRDCADIAAEVLQASGLKIDNNQSKNSAVPSTLEIIKNGAAQPRAYNQGVNWKSNWANNWVPNRNE